MKQLCFLICTCLLAWPQKNYAQQEMYFRQSWMLPAYYHPAMTGNGNDLRITAAGELDAMSIRKAPRNYLFVADLPVSSGIGVGALFHEDDTGYMRNRFGGLQGALKWHIHDGLLQVGARFGIAALNYQPNHTYFGTTVPDITNAAAEASQVKADVGAGIAYSAKRLKIGLSGHHLTAPKLQVSEDSVVKIRPVIYFEMAYNIPTHSTLMWLEPSCMVRTDFDQLRADLTLRFMRKLGPFTASVGVGYTPTYSYAGIMGLQKGAWQAGYCFEWLKERNEAGAKGRHELVLSYSMDIASVGRKKGTYKSVRFL